MPSKISSIEEMVRENTRLRGEVESLAARLRYAHERLASHGEYLSSVQSVGEVEETEAEGETWPEVKEEEEGEEEEDSSEGGDDEEWRQEEEEIEEDEEEEKIDCRVCGDDRDDGHTIFCPVCQTWQHILCEYPHHPKDFNYGTFEHQCSTCAPCGTSSKRQAPIEFDSDEEDSIAPPCKRHRMILRSQAWQ